MSILPTDFRYEIEFAAGTWTDVTADVLADPATQVQYGRTSQFSQPQIATASFELNNVSGDYTPRNADGAHYPNVVPRRRVRLTYSSGTAPVFFGYVKAFTPGLRRGVMPVVMVDAIDRMTYLQRREFDALPREQILSTGPKYYLPLSDEAGSTRVATYNATTDFPIVRKGVGTGVNPIAFGGGSPREWDEGSWAAFTSAVSSTAGNVISAPVVSGSTWSISLAFASLGDTANFNDVNLWFQASTSTPSYPSYIRLEWSLGYISYKVQTGTGSSVGTSTSTSFKDGEPHVVTLTANPSFGVKFYVDGVQISALSNVAAPGTSWASLGGALDPVAGGYGTGSYYTGSLGHFATWEKTLTDAEVADIASAILDGFAGDLTGVRIDRFAAWAGLDVSELNTSDGQEHCSPQKTKGRNIVDLWDELVTTEGGGAAMYVDTDGRLRFDDRSWRTPHASPVITIDASKDIRPGDWAPFYDDFVFASDSTVTTAHGPTAHYIDPDAVDAVTDSATTYALSATAARHLAEYRVNSSSAGIRFPRLRVNFAAASAASAAAMYAALPNLTIGSRVRIANIPKAFTMPGGASVRIFHTDRLDVYVEGWTITYGKDRFEVAWDLSPADSPARLVWDDLLFGHWQAEPGTLTLASTVTDAATTWSLTTAAGFPTLTTSPGNYPLQLLVDDEIVTIDDPPLCTGNLLSAENASFEGGTTGTIWNGAAFGYTTATLANSSTRAQAGTKSLLVTWPTAGAGASTASIALTGLDVGRWYTLSAYVWVPASNPAVRLADLFGVFYATAPTGYSPTSTTTGAWERIAVFFQAAATSGFLGIVNNAAATSGQQVWVDAVLLSEGKSVQTFTTSAAPADHGASSPQVVTVARGQVGTFADPHTAGAEVSLYPLSTWVL